MLSEDLNTVRKLMMGLLSGKTQKIFSLVKKDKKLKSEIDQLEKELEDLMIKHAKLLKK